jgi:hypothetical protein
LIYKGFGLHSISGIVIYMTGYSALQAREIKMDITDRAAIGFPRKNQDTIRVNMNRCAQFALQSKSCIMGMFQKMGYEADPRPQFDMSSWMGLG